MQGLHKWFQLLNSSGLFTLYNYSIAMKEMCREGNIRESLIIMLDIYTIDCLVCSSVHPFVSSSVRQFVRASVRPCASSSVRQIVRKFVRALVRPCVSSFVRQFVRASVRSCASSSVRQFVRASVRSCICSFAN